MAHSRRLLGLLVLAATLGAFSGRLAAAQPSPPPGGGLLAAVKAGDLAKVRALLVSGASPKVKDADGMTPLHYAAFRGDVEMGQALLAAGAEVDAADSIGMTPLHAAAFDGRDKFAALLLSKGAAANARDRAGMTPLHYAAANGREAAVRLLLAKGADPRALDGQGKRPGDLAAAQKHPNLAALLEPPAEAPRPVAKEGRRYTDEDIQGMGGGFSEEDDYPCRTPPERPKSDREYWLRYLEQGEQQIQRLATQKHDLEASLPDLQRRCEEAKQGPSQTSVGAASGPEILAPTPPGSYTNTGEAWRRQQAAAQPCTAYQSTLQRIRSIEAQIRQGRENLERYRLELGK
jgi:hypothetical protein